MSSSALYLRVSGTQIIGPTQAFQGQSSGSVSGLKGIIQVLGKLSWRACVALVRKASAGGQALAVIQGTLPFTPSVMRLIPSLPPSPHSLPGLNASLGTMQDPPTSVGGPSWWWYLSCSAARTQGAPHASAHPSCSPDFARRRGDSGSHPSVMLTMWIRLNSAQLIHNGVEPLRPLWAVSKKNEVVEASDF